MAESMATIPEFGLCTGKDCRKADGFRLVERQLRRAGAVCELPCLDVCDGPVVVLDVRSDTPVVIERVRTRALVLDVIDVLGAPDGVAVSGRIRKRMLSGSKRARARRRIARAI